MEKTLTKAIKTICCSLTGVLTISGAPQQLYAENASLPYWKDIQTVSVNREAPRSAFMTYADKNQALTGKYENSLIIYTAYIVLIKIIQNTVCIYKVWIFSCIRDYVKRFH